MKAGLEYSSPNYQEVELLFTDDGVFVDTGGCVPGSPESVTYKVKDEQAALLIEAMRELKRTKYLRQHQD